MARKSKGDTAAPDTDPAVQESFELPDYHGRKPTGMRTSLSGTGNRTTISHGIGDRLVLVTEAKVTFAGHKEVDGKLVYVESYAVVDMFEVEEPKAGSRLVAAMRARARAASDTGVRTALEGDGVDMAVTGWTDSNGVVLTEAEIAEIQGNPVAAFGTVEETVIAVYDGGRRAIWPDEFEAGAIRPSVGDLDYEGTLVAAVLDGITGEVLEGTDPGTVDEKAPAPTSLADVLPPDPPPVDVDLEHTSVGILEEHLPTASDFDLVQTCGIPALRDELEDITDLDQLHRILNAERQGRGLGKDPRTGAIAAIEARLEYVKGGVKLKLVKEAP